MTQSKTHRSTSAKKLYAVKDAKGRFKDIQEYEKAHRKDLKKIAKEEQKQREADEEIQDYISNRKPKK